MSITTINNGSFNLNTTAITTDSYLYVGTAGTGTTATALHLFSFKTPILYEKQK